MRESYVKQVTEWEAETAAQILKTAEELEDAKSVLDAFYTAFDAAKERIESINKHLQEQKNKSETLSAMQFLAVLDALEHKDFTPEGLAVLKETSGICVRDGSMLEKLQTMTNAGEGLQELLNTFLITIPTEADPVKAMSEEFETLEDETNDRLLIECGFVNWNCRMRYFTIEIPGRLLRSEGALEKAVTSYSEAVGGKQENLEKQARDIRYQKYLELKEEFENEGKKNE